MAAANRGFRAEEVASIAGLCVYETRAMLTSGPNAQPYRVDENGTAWFDLEAAGFALGIEPGAWAGRMADFHIRRIAGGVSC